MNTYTNYNRYIDNKKILKAVEEYLDKNQGIRFHQALLDLNIITKEVVHVGMGLFEEVFITDDYYTEPSEVLKRMKKE